MGLFTACFMAYGYLVSKETYDQLGNIEDKYKKYIQSLSPTVYLFRIPNSYYQFQSINSMLDAGDRSRGYVLMSQVRTMVPNESIFELSTEDQENITQLIHLISVDKNPKWWYMEGSWSSMDGLDKAVLYPTQTYEIK